MIITSVVRLNKYELGRHSRGVAKELGNLGKSRGFPVLPNPR